MAHTQRKQHARPGQSNREPDEMERDTGRGSDTELSRRSEGAQAGANRGPALVPTGGRHLNTEPEEAAHVGRTASRTPEDEKQGVTSHAGKDESARQEKVVKDRPDAKAGVNHNR